MRKEHDFVLDLIIDILNEYNHKDINARQIEIWGEVIDELAILLDDEQLKKLEKLLFFFSLGSAGEALTVIEFTLKYLSKNNLLKY